MQSLVCPVCHTDMVRCQCQRSNARSPLSHTTAAGTNKSMTAPPAPGLTLVPSDASGMQVESGTTGLSQSMNDMDISTNVRDNMSAELLEKIMVETLENEILDESELIQAHRAILGKKVLQSMRSLDELFTAADPEDLESYLRSLAYTPGHSDPFRVLGLFEIDGPTPTEEHIEKRRRFATMVLEHFGGTVLNPEVQRMVDGINGAAELCISRLPDILAQRKALKGLNKSTPRWLELLPDSLHFIRNLSHISTTQPLLVATQLSNISHPTKQNTDTSNISLNRHHTLATIQEARTLYTKLSSPPNIINAAIESLQQPTITWAPDSPEQCAKIAAAFRAMRLKGKGPEALIMLIPIDSIPTCNDPTKIMDLWSHPLTTNRFRDVVEDISISSPAHNIITTGRTSPQQVQKDLVIITLRPNHTQSPPQMINWKPYFFSIAQPLTIWIDCQETYKWQIYHIVDDLQLPGLASIDHPRPSRGTTTRAGFSNIKLHFNDAVGSQLQQQAISTFIQRQLSQFAPIIGTQSLLTDNNTKLLDIPTPTALEHVKHLTTGCVLVSPKLAVVQSDATCDAWATCLTNAWHNNPTTAPTKLRYRPSHPARNKTYAEIQATKEQIQATKARAGHDTITPTLDKPETLRATITTQVDVEGDLKTWLPTFMQCISSQSGVQLVQHEGEEGLPANHWKPIYSYEGGWTGKIVVQLAEHGQLTALHRATSDTALNIHGHYASLRCVSKFVDL
jgi:hypothetical protein